jgi:anti-sigma B factor antagonist
MLLRIDSSFRDETFVIAASGEIDIDTVDLLRGAISDALQSGVRDLTIDLDEVSYLDSSGLGVLVGAYKRVAAIQGSFTVCCSAPRILRLFKITGLSDLLHIEQTPASEDAGRQVTV